MQTKNASKRQVFCWMNQWNSLVKCEIVDAKDNRKFGAQTLESCRTLQSKHYTCWDTFRKWIFVGTMRWARKYAPVGTTFIVYFYVWLKYIIYIESMKVLNYCRMLQSSLVRCILPTTIYPVIFLHDMQQDRIETLLSGCTSRPHSHSIYCFLRKWFPHLPVVYSLFFVVVFTLIFSVEELFITIVYFVFA